MGLNRFSFAILIFCFCLYFTPRLASSTFISDDVFAASQPRSSVSRNLLQAKTGCPINFEFQNYTIITSQCKGPRYPANLCCAALKEISCPFAEQLNDLTNDCASTMFSYINLYGKYPPGLFASECREGKEGLACGVAPAESAADTSRGLITHALSPFLVLTLGLLVLFSQIF